MSSSRRFTKEKIKKASTVILTKREKELQIEIQQLEQSSAESQTPSNKKRSHDQIQAPLAVAIQKPLPDLSVLITFFKSRAAATQNSATAITKTPTPTK